MNLADVFDQTANRQPEHAAIIGPADNAVCSYRDLQKRMRAAAQLLETAGIMRGSCIGMHYPSGFDYIIWTYAIWRCGACSVPIPVELVDEEKRDICRGIGISAIITKEATARIFAGFQRDEALRLPEADVLLPIRQSRSHPDGFIDTNPAFLRFTSGTTGSSKGVVLSHQAIYDRIHAANDGLQLGPDDRVIWLLSMSYHFAVSIVAYLSFGSSIVLCKNHFGPTIVRAVARHGGTLIYGSPVHYDLMANDTSDEMLETVRLAISTATSLKQETADAFYRRFNRHLNEAYGIIEVGLPCINIENPQGHRGSVGKLLPAYQIELKNTGLGDDLKAIRLKGKGLFDAYYEPWQPLNVLAPDGWFATGDLGWLDNEGYLYIVGRSKEVINVAGMKFFPQEVEKILESHPAVVEACVFAHPHPRFGEIPHAHVVLLEDSGLQDAEHELKDFCIQHLAAFKVPDRITQVEELARTASGKIIRDQSRVAS